MVFVCEDVEPFLRGGDEATQPLIHCGVSSTNFIEHDGCYDGVGDGDVLQQVHLMKSDVGVDDEVVRRFGREFVRGRVAFWVKGGAAIDIIA